MRRRKEYMRRITLEEKILLYLYEKRGLRERYVVPDDITQSGLSDLLHVKQSHISRALTDLKRRGLVYERTSHIAGTKRRKKAYFLTEMGEEEVGVLREDLLRRYITVRDRNGRYREWTVERFLGIMGGVSFFELIHEHIEEEGGHLVGVVHKRGAAMCPDIPPVDRFFGRKREIKQIEKAINDDKIRLISVVALPGQGKSTLVSRALRGVTERQIFWYNLHPWTGLNTLLVALSSFIEEGGIRLPKSYVREEAVIREDTAAGEFLRALEKLNAVVVLDNFHSAEERIVKWARMLFSQMDEWNSPVKVILISRWRPRVYPFYRAEMGNGVLEIILEGLEKEDALQMLSSYGIRGMEAQRAYELTRGNPLAIQLYTLRPGRGEEELKTSLKRYVEEEVMEHLPPGERRLLQYLSLFRLPFGERAASLLDEDGVEDLEELKRKMLVKERRDGLLEMHELLREFVSGRVVGRRRREFSEKILEYYRGERGIEAAVERVYYAVEAGRWEEFLREFLQWGPEIAAYGYLEVGEWLELAREMDVSEWEGAQVDLIEAEYLAIRGEWERVQRLLERVEVRVREGRGKGWKKVRMHLLELQALVNAEGEVEEAFRRYRKGLEIAREAGERLEEAKILNNMGVLCLKAGRYKDALNYFKEAEGKLGGVGGVEHHFIVVLNTGDALIKLGEFRRSMEEYRRALKMAEGWGLRALEGEAMERLSEAHFFKGERREGVEWVKKAVRNYVNGGANDRAANLLLKRFREVLDVIGKGGVLSLMNEVKGADGWRRILRRRVEGDGINAVALLLKVLSEVDVDFRGFFERFENEKEFVRSFTLLQSAVRKVASEDVVRDMYSAAREVAEGFQDRHPLAIVLLRWGMWEKGRRSREILREAREIAKKIGFLSAQRKAEEHLQRRR